MTRGLSLEFLDLFGLRYVIDYCMTALKEENETKAFRIYLAECARIITGNTCGDPNKRAYIDRRFVDIINPRPIEKRSAEEIINHIKNKLNGEEEEHESV